MYVCACMYIYIWYMYIYIYIYVLMTAIRSVQSLSVIMSVKKKWQKIPQWSGMMITVIALCRWGQFCLLFKMGCGRVRIVTVIVIICHCCYCFCCFPRLRNSDRTSSLMNKLWHYSVPCHIFIWHLPLYLYDWSPTQMNLPSVIQCGASPGGHCWNTYFRWVGSLRFICGSGTRRFHLRMSSPQMGSRVSPIVRMP